jgi:hypothetical protein
LRVHVSSVTRVVFGGQVLMSDDDLASGWAPSARGYRLQRNEVIALLNLLAQLSKSVHSVQAWRRRELQLALLELAGRLLTLVVGLWLAWSAARRWQKSRRRQGPAVLAASLEDK